MSVKRPIGMNSEVLNTNAAHVSPKSGSHCRSVMPLFSKTSLPFSQVFAWVSFLNVGDYSAASRLLFR